MDILDILIAKNQSFTAETARLTQQANAAMAKANAVAAKADDIQTILDDASAANDAAEAANARSQEVVDLFDSISDDLNSAVDAVVDDRIANADVVTDVEVADDNTVAAKVKKIRVRKKGLQQAYDTMKNYTTTGQNEDGGMTQKAITEELSKMTSGNLGSENYGKIVVIGADGSLVSGDLTEDEIKEGINNSGSSNVPVNEDVLGVVIDYENKIISRAENAIGLTPGSDFNKYKMYGGRMRCNVNIDGEITAWYGDNNYADDGSNGDVMIYQPKFYYKRVINKAINNTVGKIIKKETLYISEVPASGFKLHPRFKDTSNNELEYILMPAYEGCTYDVSANQYNLTDDSNIDFNYDYLASRAGAKPISGQNNELNITAAEKLATNKGAGWHITDIGVESINQMLFMIEYATLNGQNAIGLGICNLNSTAFNNAINTGATSSLGNGTGEGSNSSIDGERAVSYRGYENLWGNTWRFIGGIGIKADSGFRIGIPYVATSFTYDAAGLAEYESVEFNIAKVSNWISAMGYGNEKYDWIYLPAECSGANSAVPVGDNFWAITDFTRNGVIGIGGTWSFNLYDGPFYYSCDRPYNYKSYSYNARLMYIPTKNSTHNTNYQAWLTKIGG